MFRRVVRLGQARHARRPTSLRLTLLALGLLFAFALLLHWLPRSRRRPNRFQLSPSLYTAPSGVFNPAAAFQAGRGWVLIFRWDKCHFRTCGIHNTSPQALISYLGDDPNSPDLGAVTSNPERWSYQEEAYAKLLVENEAEVVNTADLRPFIWHGEMYAGHWLKYGWTSDTPPAQHMCWDAAFGPHSCEYAAISRLDFAKKEIVPVYQYKTPIFGTEAKREKNWAFVEVGEMLKLVYSVFPCTVVYRVTAAPPNGAEFEAAYCYRERKKIKARTGHDIRASRNSGNPVAWRAPGGSTELLGMVHARVAKHSYENWLVRMHPASLCLTHISATPVLRSRDFRTGGFYKGVLVVGSFHVLRNGSNQGLRMFIGEGDQYSGWDDVALASNVKWYRLDEAAILTLRDEDNAVKEMHARAS